jgi:HK97 family phage major capsid protein
MSMKTLAEMQAKRNELAGQIRQFGERFNAQGKKWKDAEEAKNWEKLNADYDANLKEMQEAQSALNVGNRLAQIEQLQNEPNGLGEGAGLDDARNGVQGRRRAPGAGGGAQVTDEHRALALAGWMRAQLGEPLTRRHREAARLTGINPRARQLAFDSLSTQSVNAMARKMRGTHPATFDPENFYNAPMTVGTGSTGGYTRIPETLLRTLEINMLAFDGVAQVAELLVTETGETLTWPTFDDTAQSGVQIGENADLFAAGSGSTPPTIGRVQWASYKLSSGALLVPYELLEDNVVDLPSVLGTALGERIGRLRNTRYTTGTGTSQAKGIVTAASLGVTAASATVIAPDEVYSLQHSVDPAYRIGAAFMANDSTVLHLRQKKDSQNRYLWQSGFNEGVPDTLAGSKLYLNQAMAAIATGNKTLLYGQLSKYKIRRVNGFRLYRLEERYRDSDQDGFILLVAGRRQPAHRRHRSGEVPAAGVTSSALM